MDTFLLRVAANTGTDPWLEIPRNYKKAEKDYHNPLTSVQRTENIADRSAVFFPLFIFRSDTSGFNCQKMQQEKDDFR